MLSSAWPVVTMSCTLPKSASTSARVLPLMVLVSSDADAFEMAQPEPWKLASFTTSPSMTR